MIENIYDVLTICSLVIGVFFILTGSLGLLKLPDVFSRIHSAGMIDTAGAGFIILGMIFQSGISLATAKLVFIAIFIFFSSPVSSHVISNLARKKGLVPIGKKRGKLL
tara:strand:+ start:2623 stop:2946 length:324 start_codon:yes stop_codon:yes gene_type:complete